MNSAGCKMLGEHKPQGKSADNEGCIPSSGGYTVRIYGFTPNKRTNRRI